MKNTFSLIPVISFTSQGEKLIYVNQRFISVVVPLTVGSFEIQMFSQGEIFSVNCRGNYTYFLTHLSSDQPVLTKYYEWLNRYEIAGNNQPSKV